jgi:hypothetical protein
MGCGVFLQASAKLSVLMRIILCRTDRIGDVILTLPMAGVLKEKFPGCTVIFLGRNYFKFSVYS